jgi:hypothetical protein
LGRPAGKEAFDNPKDHFWADILVKPTWWGDMAADANLGTTYEGIVPTGWREAEEVSRGQWNCGVADANYWDNSGNDGNWIG